MTQLVDSIETRSCQIITWFTKLKNQWIIRFFPLSVPLLSLSSAPKVGWHHRQQPGASFWGDDGSPCSWGRLEGSHSILLFLCSGTLLSVPSKMLEHTRIIEILRSCRELKEEAPASFCISGPMLSEFPQGHAWAPAKGHHLSSRGVSMGDSCCQWDTHRNQPSVWQYKYKFLSNVVPFVLFQHTDEHTASFRCLGAKERL